MQDSSLDNNLTTTARPQRALAWAGEICYEGNVNVRNVRSCVRVSVVAAAFLASGCAWTTQTLEPPQAPAWYGGIQRGAGRDIVVVPFVDRRKMPHLCGIKKNGYSQPAAHLLCSMPPERWLSDLVAEGLSESGFDVSSAIEDAPPSALIVSGALEQTFVEPDMGVFSASAEADVWLTIAVSNKNGFRARRSFYVKGSDTYLGGIESAGQNAFDTAMRETVVDVVAAVENLAEARP